MSARRNVHLVTEEQATTAAVSAAMGYGETLESQDVSRDLQSLAHRLERHSAAAVLVDIDPGPGQMLASLDSLTRRFAETRFIVLSRTMSSELVLEAMQTGARHFMIKDSIPLTLAGVLDKLCGNSHSGRAARGTAVNVLSASGGAGATTLAVNLACELEAATHDKTLLIDLDFSYGGVSAYLGIDGQHGVAELLERSTAIDADLIQTAAQSYSEKLRVLMSTPGAMLGERTIKDWRGVEGLIAAGKDEYKSVIIDAPRVPLDVAAQLSRISAATFIVFQLTVKDVRLARLMISALEARGISDQSIVPVVNRYHRKRTLVKLDEAQKALNGHPIRCLSNDFQAASHSSNFGQPLLKAAPRSELRQEICKMAEAVANGSILQSKGNR